MMTSLKKLFSTFRFRLTLTFVGLTLLVTAVCGYFILQFALNEQLQQIRSRLMMIAQTATFSVDPDLVAKIPLDRSAVQTEAYKQTVQTLSKVKEANPFIVYIYIMTQAPEPGNQEMIFVADPDPYYDATSRFGPSAYPGDRYNASRFPQMYEGFHGPAADPQIVTDEWGPMLSGYAPIRSRDGKIIAMLGVDMMARDIYDMQRQVHVRVIGVLLAGILLSMILGFIASRRMTGRLNKLTEGTHRLAEEDLDFQVELEGHDEIADLAGSFNRMSSKLSESRSRLQDYFFRSMQSLVRILEAKDSYTRGHSERVAVYAEKLGRQMKLPEDDVTLLKKAALLHDIGKLVVHENILNKEGPLNDQEWRIIMQHPVVGEEVVKPLQDNELISSMIRSHHERYDGKGYPDATPGDQTPLLAQIISVVDAYDAMTTTRAYRKSLSKETAIQELQEKSGTQFNPQVVEAFLKVLETPSVIAQ